MVERIIKIKILYCFVIAFMATHGIAQSAYPDVINIGLYHNKKITSAAISAQSGGFFVYGDKEMIFDLHAGSALHLSLVGDSLHLSSYNGAIGVFSEIRFYKKEWGNTFRIKPINPASGGRIFPDNLFVRLSSGHLVFINNTNLASYIAGAVQTEAGRKCNSEYYKVQAIICRTFALAHTDRHLDEGFNLCDEVHCQAFHGIDGMDRNISRAVAETKDYVLVDSDINLITAAYHSNCGGYTANSEDVWRQSLPYLRARKDTFCIHMPNATWTKSMDKTAWHNYLATHFKLDHKDSLLVDAVKVSSTGSREKYFLPGDSLLNMIRLRTDLHLPSAYFGIREEGDSIVFEGRGYGHGVGLCQEGAMHMADLGYSFSDILHYYYKDVHLIDLSAISFFRED